MATLTTTKHNGGTMGSSQPPVTSAKGAVSLTLPRPYKDFLTPALHRRFTKATGVVLVVCWLEAAVMSHAGWFWSWFPLSLTGLRSLVLFIPCLCVFILRVANMHIGHLASTSSFETVVQRLAGRAWVKTAVTALWYSFGAWLFGEIYIWSRSTRAGLGWVDYGRPYERPRLNENAIYLRSLLLIMAGVQTVVHVLWDYDRVDIIDMSKSTASQSGQDDFIRRLQKQKQRLLLRPLNLALVSMLLSLGVYFLGIRGIVWDFYHWLARLYTSQLPPNTGPVGLTGLLGLAWQALTACYMLGALWTISNAIFTLHVAMPPIKKGQPLTNEIKDLQGNVISRSTDPNGSLIRGLMARNEVPRSFAFWELFQICENFPDRRRTIFTEVERKDRPQEMSSTWAAISGLCLEQIEAVARRISSTRMPIPSQSESAQRTQHEVQSMEPQQPLGLPKIANQRVKDDRDVVLHARSNDFSASAGSAFRRLGQNPGSATAFTSWAGRAVQHRADEALPLEWRKRFVTDSVSRNFHDYFTSFLKTAFGALFRQTFARRVRAVVFGVPHSAEANIVHATRALTKLVLESLKEDDYGQVAKEVPAIVRTLTATIVQVQSFVGDLAPHWSDVDFDGNRHVREIDAVVTEFKTALEQILLAFDEYASAIGLTKQELRAAKEAVGREPQMVKL